MYVPRETYKIKKFKTMFHVKHRRQKKDNVSRGTLNLFANNLQMIYSIYDTTFMFEPGQNWKIAALRTSKCVCHFFV